MKQKLFFVFASAIASSTLFMSCQKDLKASNDATVRNTPLPTTGTYCRIERMDVSDGQVPSPYSLIFRYDEFENPVSITPTHPILYTRPTRYFYYDHWHRLSQYQDLGGTIGATTSGPVLVYNDWHFYGYDLNGRIGADTAYIEVVSTEVLSEHTYGSISKIEYDTQGRIVRETIKELSPGFTQVRDYAYDSQGNLIRNSPTTYDTKQSMLRTNDIWMFLMRDYSMNNPSVAAGYNSTGYPALFNSPFNWFNSGFNQGVVIYDCRQSHYF